MATWTDIDHIKITIDYTETTAAPLYIKTIIPTDNSLRIKTLAVEGTPYIDCDNKNESLESMFKRCIVLAADGSLVLQVHYI